MTADDTSRDALIERVARRIHEAADYEAPVMPWDQQTDDWRAEVSSLAAAVVDTVVMPLVQGVRTRGDAAIKRAEAAEAAHKALTEAVRELADAWEDDARPVAGRIVTDIRAILDENGATR